MRKSILRTVGLAAIAALVCAGCTDVVDDGHGGLTGDSRVDRFLGLYTVTFNANWSYYSYQNSSAPAAMIVVPGDSVKIPGRGDMTIGDYYGYYVFDGWNTSPNGRGTNYVAGSYYKPTGNVTLYAKWKRRYRITFDANGGAGTARSAITADSGSSATLPAKGSSLTRSNHVFGGWNTSCYDCGTGTNYAVGSSYKPTDNVTLYAKWNPTYRVTFSANGGTGTVPAAITGDTITLPNGNALTKSGYNFGGWYTFANTNVWTNYNAGSRYAPTDNVTMYAKWDNNSVTTFKDSRDNKTYKKVTISGQTWMAQNLNYDDPNDIPGVVTDTCYSNSADSCAKYGRAYTWSIAMGGNTPAPGSSVQGVCPSGWHVPSYDEWNTLITHAGGASTAGTKLKSSVGWYRYDGIPAGTDEYGFSALPNNGNYGQGGIWWTANNNYNYMSMSYSSQSVNNYSNGSQTNLYSVRCVQDD
jgi:uncharacterized protein (TIGR02145 family)/uncharacterized repeat protein (TIGR02543 family)